MAYNPGTNIVVSGKTFMDVPSVQFKTPDGATVNFAHVGGSIRFSPTLEEQTNNVENFSNAIIDPITSTLLNQLDSDFVAENIKKDVNLFGLLGTLEAGGGSGSKISTGTYTSAADTAYITVQHTLGVIPTFAFVCVLYGGSERGLLMLFQNELTLTVNYEYGNYLDASEPLTAAGSTEAKIYNIRAYGANESDISFGVNTTNWSLFMAGNTYQWIVGVTE